MMLRRRGMFAQRRARRKLSHWRREGEKLNARPAGEYVAAKSAQEKVAEGSRSMVMVAIVVVV
jgi:hypothetical protein